MPEIDAWFPKTPQEILEQEERHYAAWKAIRALNVSQRLCIIAKYGLCGDDWTMEDFRRLVGEENQEEYIEDFIDVSEAMMADVLPVEISLA